MQYRKRPQTYRDLMGATECYWCFCLFNSPEIMCSEPTMDHMVTRARGGSDLPTNLVRACVLCNRLRSDMDVSTFSLIAEVIKADRHDLQALAAKFKLSGQDILAKVCNSLYRNVVHGAVEEVSIPMWKREEVCAEVGEQVPWLGKDVDRRWRQRFREIRIRYDLVAGDRLSDDVSGASLRYERRRGHFDGQIFELVDEHAWHVLRSMKVVPEAKKFIRQTGDSEFRFYIWTLGSDVVVVLDYRIQGSKFENRRPWIFAQSEEVAAKLFEVSERFAGDADATGGAAPPDENIVIFRRETR